MDLGGQQGELPARAAERGRPCRGYYFTPAAEGRASSCPGNSPANKKPPHFQLPALASLSWTAILCYS